MACPKSDSDQQRKVFGLLRYVHFVDVSLCAIYIILGGFPIGHGRPLDLDLWKHMDRFRLSGVAIGKVTVTNFLDTRLQLE